MPAVEVITWVCPPCGHGWTMRIETVVNRPVLSGGVTCSRCGGHGVRRGATYLEVPLEEMRGERDGDD